MSRQNKELEVKFYVADLDSIETQLKRNNAHLVQRRTYEYNLRFDNPNGELAKGGCILRLRKDTANRLTYKGPGSVVDGVHDREEIEITVSDFDISQDLLEALGFQVSMAYEKYRTVYDLDGVLAALDEMPFGNFIEIEGPDRDRIKKLSTKLGLRWGARILKSYGELFQVVCTKLGAEMDNLIFANFTGLEVTPEDLSVCSADGA